MSAITNIFTTLFRVILGWLQGIWCLIRLIGVGIRALFGGGGVKANLAAAFGKASTQRLVFGFLRAFVPNFSISKIFVKAYDNTSTAVITRHNDVHDVLNRDADFEVVYGSRMRKLTDGDNFFLGMQPGWDYTRDTSAVHLAMRNTDVKELVQPRAERLANEIVGASKTGKMDIVPELTLQVPWDMTNTYFGAGGPDKETMQDWATILFWYLFEDLGADPDFDAKSMRYAAEMRSYLDKVIADLKANPSTDPTILNRMLELQGADTPGMDDLGIRNNILGLLIGAIPTISKASCFALDELLNRPDALKVAHEAALRGDHQVVANTIWECLRFNPHNPVVYRRATHDTTVAQSTLRQVKIKEGTMVFAATFSAMFDSLVIDKPNEFRTDRSWETYIIWGYGMHTCIGAQINMAVIPAILTPLLKQKNLRRAKGAAGQIDSNGTPHPEHFHVEFDT